MVAREGELGALVTTGNGAEVAAEGGEAALVACGSVELEATGGSSAEAIESKFRKRSHINS